MSARDLAGEGLELSLRGGSHVARAAAKQQPQRPGRRRTTLAELGEHLETLSEPASVTNTAKRALAAYTFARVVANLAAFAWDDLYVNWNPWDDLYLTCDAVLRPVITGFGVFFFLRRNDRFSEKSLLHIWSRRTIFSLAFFIGDEGFRALVLAFYHHDLWTMDLICNAGTLLWEIACNCMQVHMTNLKLRALGLSFTAKFCHFLAAIGLVSTVLESVTIMMGLDPDRANRFVLLGLMCCFVTLLTQCCSLCIAAGSPGGTLYPFLGSGFPL